MATKKKDTGMSSANPSLNTPVSPFEQNSNLNSNVDTTKDTVVHTSPPGVNDTVIYNSGTGQYRVQRRTPGTNNIIEFAANDASGAYDPNSKPLYQGTNDTETRGIAAKAGIEDQKIADAYAKAHPPENVTPEQLAQVGQLSEPGYPNLQPGDLVDAATMQDPVTQDILNQQQNRINVDKNYPEKVLQKSLGFINKIPIAGDFIKEQLYDYRATREFMQDYSQEANFEKVKVNIGKAQKQLTTAITVANKPGDIQMSQKAIQGYNDAILQLKIADVQMKMIEDSDQREYVDKIKKERSNLKTYLDKNVYGVGGLNDKFTLALQNPNPATYNAEMARLYPDVQDNVDNGGGVNG